MDEDLLAIINQVVADADQYATQQEREIYADRAAAAISETAGHILYTKATTPELEAWVTANRARTERQLYLGVRAILRRELIGH